MEEIEQLGNQETDCRCQRKLNALLASALSSIETVKEENLQHIRNHQTIIYAIAFLRKKYEANGQVVPSRPQLESYIAEFNYGSHYIVLITLPSNKHYRVNVTGSCQCCRSR